MSKIIEILQNPPRAGQPGSTFNLAFKLASTGYEIEYPEWKSRIFAALKQDGWIKVEDAVNALPKKADSGKYMYQVKANAIRNLAIDDCINALRSLAGKE